MSPDRRAVWRVFRRRRVRPCGAVGSSRSRAEIVGCTGGVVPETAIRACLRDGRLSALAGLLWPAWAFGEWRRVSCVFCGSFSDGVWILSSSADELWSTLEANTTLVLRAARCVRRV